MTTQEMPMQEGQPVHVQRRVVEAEVRLPRVEELKLPKVDLKPVRSVAGEVLLTGLGIGVLMVRGVLAAVRAAHEAGKKEMENPGPVTKAVLGLVRQEEKPIAHEIRVIVPVLPVDDYDGLAVADILVRLPDLSESQLRVLREYEIDHQARAEVIEAIDNRLGVG
jgi:hypothetical protein